MAETLISVKRDEKWDSAGITHASALPMNPELCRRPLHALGKLGPRQNVLPSPAMGKETNLRLQLGVAADAGDTGTYGQSEEFLQCWLDSLLCIAQMLDPNLSVPYPQSLSVSTHQIFYPLLPWPVFVPHFPFQGPIFFPLSWSTLKQPSAELEWLFLLSPCSLCLCYTSSPAPYPSCLFRLWILQDRYCWLFYDYAVSGLILVYS